MRRSFHLAVFFVLLVFAAGCASGRGSRGSRQAGKRIAKTARGQIGGRYKFGGASPKKGFDCSGLAWWTHKRHGIRIPRVSFSQYKNGRRVKRKNLTYGDLVFFTTYKKGPSHVGIYTGKGTFIHAPSTGKRIRSDPMSNKYWKKRYLGARRYH